MSTLVFSSLPACFQHRASPHGPLEVLTIQTDFGKHILLAKLVLIVEIARFEDYDNQGPDLLS